MSAGPARLLFIDFETTGLLDDWLTPTLLEVAWTITDGMGEQLSALRHQFLRCNAAGESIGLITPRALAADTGVPLITWDLSAAGLDTATDYPVAAVREMHQQSGLTSEWARADLHHPDWIMSGIELDAALCADLDEHALRMPPRTLRLAGNGVAQFEARFLPEVAPQAMSSEFPWHYRTADLSVELSNAQLRGGTVSMDSLLDTTGARDLKVDSEIHTSVHPSLVHRAASDVARAVWAWRELARRGW